MKSIKKPMFKAFYKSILCVSALVFLCSHNLYIKLDSYILKPNQAATLSLYNGTFETSENIITRDRIIDASIVYKGERLAIDASQWTDQDSTITQFKFNPIESATYVTGVSTKAKNISLTAEKFNHYLEHDGVLDMLKERQDRNDLDKDATERYEKHVKVIYQVGKEKTTDWKTVLGYPIEFVPQENPYDKYTGESLSIQLILDGKPLANQLVYADYVKVEHNHDHGHDHGHNHDNHADDKHDHDHHHDGEAHKHDHEAGQSHKHKHEGEAHSHEHHHKDGDHDHHHYGEAHEHDHEAGHSHKHKHEGEAHSHEHHHKDGDHDHHHDGEVHKHDHEAGHSHKHKHEGEAHSHEHHHKDGDHDHHHDGEAHKHDHEEDHSHEHGKQLRTDKDGLVVVDFPEDGIYFLRTIYMEKVTNNDEITHQSKWATLTFEVTHSHEEEHGHDHDHEEGIPTWIFVLGSAVIITLLFLGFRKKD